MIDIERQLKKIEYKKIPPDEKLISDTKRILRQEMNRKTAAGKRNLFRGMAIGVPVMAALVVALLMIFNPGHIIRPVVAKSAFYTIDINPSVVLEVDENERITGITCRNEEALELMNGLPCLGLDIRDAIPLIVTRAKELGYIADDTEDYVLIARFGDDGKSMSEDEVNRIVLDATSGQTNVLYLIGSLQDKEDAEKAGKSAGIYLLEKHAKEQGIMDREYTSSEGSIKEDMKAINLPSSQLEATVEGDLLILEWEQIVHSEFSGYKVVASLTNPEPAYPEDGYIIFIEDSETTRLEITEGLFESLIAGKEYYFSITVLYKGGFTKNGNSVKVFLPQNGTDVEPTPVPSPTPEPNPTPEPVEPSTPVPAESTEPSPVPTAAPTPEPTPDPMYLSSTITGLSGEDGVVLEWGKIDNDKFQGYKVVASRTNSSPSYPDDGYISYITDKNITTAFFSFNEFEGGAEYWFSITVLYNDGVKVPGNAVLLPIPENFSNEQVNTEKSSTIEGVVAGGIIHLEWTQIADPAFQGYKVVASKSNPSPSYPADGYIKYITNASNTVLDVFEGYSGLKGGQSYWFSITVLYNDGTRVPGNAIYLKVPDLEQEADEKPVPLVEASISEGQVLIEWSTEAHPMIEGFKVVASNTNPSPSYPDDGYIAYISAGNYQGYAAPVGSFLPGETYWFSVTTLFSDGTKTIGNSVELLMPEGEELQASQISGSIVDGYVVLEWSVIESDFFQGYKVVKSSTNPNPVYPTDGYHVYITDRFSNSYSIPLTELDSGVSYYFSITTLYSTGARIPGNTITLEIP